MSKNKYKCVIYLRLSREDGDKEESYSISNQRDLVMDFLSRHPEISLVAEMVDDGYTGSNFERPAFKKMIDMITNGEADCVIVKDLSRFARDYIGSGYYLEKLFPSMGVRFIAINDNIDYMVDDSSNTRLIMAFKNVLNDAYIHDISVKIRSQFDIKRRKGEYIGAFVAYGYKKSAVDKHKIVIDKNAAEVVRSIFNQRIHGISANAIADKLNLLGVPSPAEYKKLCGSNFSANFKKSHVAKWSANAVIRILKNEIYTGTLIQGKHTTVNYKVKKIVEKDMNEWNIIKNSHESVISQEQFDTVQELIKHDTRVNPGEREPYLFSGFLVCADCGMSMVRRLVRKKGKCYVYYMCSTNKLGMGCSSHRVREDTLYSAAFESINAHCRCVSDLSEKVSKISFETIKNEKQKEIDTAISRAYTETEDLRRTIAVVQGRYTRQLEEKAVCDEICADINSEISDTEARIERLHTEKNEIIENFKRNTIWFDIFSKYGDVQSLNRAMLAHLVDSIYIYEEKRISIRFKYENNYEQLLTLADKIGGTV